MSCKSVGCQCTGGYVQPTVTGIPYPYVGGAPFPRSESIEDIIRRVIREELQKAGVI